MMLSLSAVDVDVGGFQESASVSLVSSSTELTQLLLVAVYCCATCGALYP